MDKLKMQSTPKNEILVEEQTIKTYGQNYKAVKVKNKINLLKIVKLVFCFLFICVAVLGVLVACGV